MSSASSNNTNARYNPEEPRDGRGRWTTGGSSWRDNPVRRPSPAGRAHLLLGHALASAWHQGLIPEFKLPTEAEAGRFARTLRTWNAASDLAPETFRETFTHGLVDRPATVARLRAAAAGWAEAQTIGQMVDASRPLTAAIKDIGAHRWDGVREELADKAAAALPVQFAAPVGTIAPTVGTGQTAVAAGDRPQGRGPGNADEGQSRAATNSQSDNKGPSTGLSAAGDPPSSGALAWVVKAIQDGMARARRQGSSKGIQVASADNKVPAGAVPAPSDTPRPLSVNERKKQQADALESYLKATPGKTLTRNSGDGSKPDPFAAFAFPIMFFCEGSLVSKPIAGITGAAYQQILQSKSVRPEDLKQVQASRIPTLETVANFYRAYIDDAMRRVVPKNGYELLADDGNGVNEKAQGILNFNARLAFIDALFAPGPTDGAKIIRDAIKDTCAQFKMKTPPLRDSGVIDAQDYVAFRYLANTDIKTRDFLTQRLRKLLDGLDGFGGRITNTNAYMQNRSPTVP